MYILPVTSLSDRCEKVFDFETVHHNNRNTELIVEADDEVSVGDQLSQFFDVKMVKREQSFSKLFHWDEVGGNGTPPCAVNITKPTGKSLYKAHNCIVIPVNNLILQDTSIVGERFGKTKAEYLAFLVRYSKFFGYDRTTDSIRLPHDFKISELSTEQEVALYQNGRTPVLLSNHLHDRVYAHWFFFAIYQAWILNQVRTIKEFVFIFTYVPLTWQVSSLYYYFGDSVKYTIIDNPTRFPYLYFVSARSNAFLDGEFLSYLYSRGDRQKRKLAIRKLFLSRRDAKNRNLVNELEVNSVLLEFGFTSVVMSDYNFSDQISLISSATDIIFLAGSSGVNLIHADSNCRVTIVTFPGGTDPWKELCHNFGLFNVQQFVSTITPNGDQFDLYIDIPKFREFLSICS
jgi:capsular polysaccharide biosynthesis protein